MASSFQPISGIINVDFGWDEPDPDVLRHPSGYRPESSRIVFHESVHYWQQIGQGFLTRMVEEDWQRLVQFESNGSTSDAGQYRYEFVRNDPVLGFSARDLHESLARFWDVHVIGPHRLLEIDFEDPRRAISDEFKALYHEKKIAGQIIHPQHGGYSNLAFDMAMSASAGNYARPYQYIQEHYNPIVTGTVFPLAGHFALQTDRPIELFPKIVEAVAPSIARLPADQAIHDLWKVSYGLVRNRAFHLVNEGGKRGLMLPGALIQNGPLNEHPVYSWVLKELDRAADMLAETSFAKQLAKIGGFDNVTPILRGIFALDFCLACPGDTTNRSFLVEWLAPPCVNFPDNQTWLLGEVYRRELVPESTAEEETLSSTLRKTAMHVQDIHERWAKFRTACRGY